MTQSLLETYEKMTKWNESTHNIETCCTEGRDSSWSGNKRISFMILAHRTGSSLRRNKNDCFADALLVPEQYDIIHKCYKSEQCVSKTSTELLASDRLSMSYFKECCPYVELERFVTEMTYYVSSGMLMLSHSTHSPLEVRPRCCCSCITLHPMSTWKLSVIHG